MQNVLFLGAGNSTRSLMAEALLRHWGEGQLTAFSAGGDPAGTPHPAALRILEARGIAATGLRSKSWAEFASPHAPAMDLAIAVCDTALAEHCPVLPGAPLRLHWSLPDPQAAIGGEAATAAAFAAVFEQLEQRIAQLVTIPFADRDAKCVRADLEAIAAMA